MSALLDSRAALLRQFYHHLNTDATDDALIEHDAATGEQADRYLQFGLWNAQAFLVGLGLGERWRAVSSALSWSGSETSNGGRYLSLADGGSFTRFLKLAGDDKNSALRSVDGTRWGTEIYERNRFDVRGNYYYLLGDDELWVTKGANVPTGTVADYYQRHAPLESGTTIDFPVDLTPLIPAEAAYLAIHDAWVALSDQQQSKVAAVRKHWRDEAARRRRSRTPKRMRANRTFDSQFWSRD